MSGLVRAVVDGAIRFEAPGCPLEALEALRRELTFPNPERVSRERMRLSVFGVPRTLSVLLVRRDGLVEIPRGAVGVLRRHLDAAGVDLRFVDRRRVLPPAGFRASVELRPYQREAVDAMRRGVQGVVVMPPGAGKTVCGVATIAAVDQPALVLVHTRDLLEQWRQQVARILGVEAGVVAEGAARPAPVTVATVQTLSRMAGDELDALARGFGLVLVDEAHHAPAATFREVLRRVPARWRFGLTATPRREDGLGPLLDLTVGPRLCEVSHAALVAGGHLAVPEVRAVYSNFEFAYQSAADHSACIDALVADAGRNALVAELAAREARGGHSVLVLSGRVVHCRRLAALIRARGVRAEVLVGEVRKADRTRILDELRAGTLPVVVASTVADEGLDVPRLDRVILATPARARGRTAQRLGRVMRPHESKSGAVLFDIVDVAVPPLVRQYQERRTVYARLGA